MLAADGTFCANGPDQDAQESALLIADLATADRTETSRFRPQLGEQRIPGIAPVPAKVSVQRVVQCNVFGSHSGEVSRKAAGGKRQTDRR